MMSPSTEAALAGLKDFQRRTVDYVFDRLYGGDADRFLVADEVGLGKTLIARGVAARAIDHLRKTVPRIDVIYVCSNGDIARQNINRLRVDNGHKVLTTRLTMLPRDVKHLGDTKTEGVNFVSFTPSTSFDVKGGLGKAEERLLLYWMLRDAWGFGATKAPMNVFQGGVRSPERFRAMIDAFDTSEIDPQAQAEFRGVLAGRRDLEEQFEALCDAFSRTSKQITDDAASMRAKFVGAMRAVLARSCVKSLEPDLVILDEFQRFSHLLDGDDDASLLARELFEFKDVRVLMLSATPYKMYTQREDPQGEDHYRDFLRTLKFLENGRVTQPIEPVLREYREALYGLTDPSGRERLAHAKGALESRLRRVMVRTERLASTPDRNGMLVEVPAAVGEMKASDVTDYLALQTLAHEIEHDDTVEYWKSAPYLLSFMGDGYQLRRDIYEKLESAEGRAFVARALNGTQTCNLTWSAIERYGAIDPGNARLRGLVSDVVDSGAWRLLWVPPSLPYYRLGGPYAEPKLAGFTKRLVFSSWLVVPRVIAGMLSYETERRMYAGDPTAVNTPEARKKRKPLLRFARSDGRLTGMPVLALLYPSLVLARKGDPLALSVEHARERDAQVDTSVDSTDLLELAKERIAVSLERIRVAETDGPVDERWYWAAPLLLDQQLEPAATKAWLEQEHLAAKWSGAEAEPEDDDDEGEPDAWADHVKEALDVARDPAAAKLGRMPEDLVDVLAQLALAGPAVAMMRAFERVVGGEHQLEAGARIALRNAAGRTASAFRTLFNQPEVMAMLREGHRGSTELPYWRTGLQYCVNGCLQAVLDEYVHVLREHLGLMAGTIGQRAGEIAEAIAEALALRTSRIGVDDLTLSEAGRTVKAAARRNMRTHFALRFGDEANDDGTVITRADSVRKAFNSPFWPFVVATTSVGQEGLDFHTYCHAVVHWNLPSNPVDLEQREGRVHRYKNHAVRKNVALRWGATALDEEARDPWEASFEAAKGERAADATDIVPYWVYTVPNGARIERHVPALPLSRERAHMSALSRTLVLYRMVFGQPRQEDLVRHLRAVACDERLGSALNISLSP